MVDEAALQEVIFTTFLTSGTATLIAAAIGVPLGAWCARQTASFFSKLQTVITALYGLPPVVVGVFVYSLFSKSGMATLATTPFPIKINRKVPTNSAQNALMSVVCYVPCQDKDLSGDRPFSSCILHIFKAVTLTLLWFHISSL